jgi:hypothetical protein
MQLKFKILMGAVAAGLSAGAAAQMPPPTEQPTQSTGSEGMSQQQPSSTDLTRQSGSQSEAAEVKPATAADIKAGVEIFDQKGGAVGKVESVDADGVVVSTGSVKAKIPASSFGRGDKGLVIAMTKAEFEAAAKEKSPK